MDRSDVSQIAAVIKSKESVKKHLEFIVIFEKMG